MLKKAILLVASLLSGCAGVPKDLTVVGKFEPNRYLGTWYEIARLDHSFERGLINVTAHYEALPKDAIRVINRGYDPAAKQWRQVEGKALFVSQRDVGRLKVSFFGPFYGAYNIIDLDRANYSYALVCGPNRSYFWILSREPEMDSGLLTEFVAHAKSSGFDTEHLHYMGKHP